jgi:hypothetical protein
MYVCVGGVLCAHACVCQKETSAPGAGVTDTVSVWCGCWEPNLLGSSGQAVGVLNHWAVCPSLSHLSSTPHGPCDIGLSACLPFSPQYHGSHVRARDLLVLGEFSILLQPLALSNVQRLRAISMSQSFSPWLKECSPNGDWLDISPSF